MVCKFRHQADTSSMADHFGETLARLRRDRALSVRRTSKLAGVDERTIRAYEQSESFSGHGSTLDKLIAAFHGAEPISDADADYLFEQAGSEFIKALWMANAKRGLPAAVADAKRLTAELRGEPIPQGPPPPATPDTTALYRMTDALIALTGPRRAAILLSQLIAATAEPTREDDDSSSTPPGLIAVHQPPVETEDGTFAARTFHQDPRAAKTLPGQQNPTG